MKGRLVWHRVVCVYCGVTIYNDSDSNPPDAAGPWLEISTTDETCSSSPDHLHHRAQVSAP